MVADELDRLSRVSNRLIRMIGLQDETTSEIVDIDRILAQSIERWRVVTDRRWVLEAGAGNALGSPERLRTCIDTLVENAIHRRRLRHRRRLQQRGSHQQGGGHRNRGPTRWHRPRPEHRARDRPRLRRGLVCLAAPEGGGR